MFKENITGKREIKQIRECEKIQTSLSCKIETEEDVKKVLSHFCKVTETNTEVLEGQLVINGELCCNAVYLNSEDCFNKAHGTVNFSDKINDSNISINSTVGFCKMSVIACKVTAFNGKEIKVEAVVEILVEIIKEETIELNGENLGDVFIKTDNTELKLLKQKVTECFSAELSIKTKEEIKDILFTKSRSLIKSVEVKNGYIVVNGEINSKIVYLTNEEEPKLKVAEDSASFSEEIKTGIDSSDVICDAMITVKEETSEIKDKEAMLKIELVVTMLIFEKDTMTSVIDAYSLSKEINLSYASCYNETLNSKENFSETISSRITLKSSDLARVKVIDCVEKGIVVTSVTPNENYLVVDGVATYNILFEELPEDLVTSQVNSVEAELPFSVKLRKQVSEGEKLKVNVSFKDSHVFQAKNSEAEISSALSFDVCVYNAENIAYVSAFNFGDEKPVNRSSLSLYITKDGDDIWSISKNLNVDPEILAEQNKELMEDTTPAGMQIIFYRQKTRAKV